MCFGFGFRERKVGLLEVQVYSLGRSKCLRLVP